jgi:hypothetical protein
MFFWQHVGNMKLDIKLWCLSERHPKCQRVKRMPKSLETIPLRVRNLYRAFYYYQQFTCNGTPFISCGLTTVNCHNMKMTKQNHSFTPKRIIFQKTICTKKCVSSRWSPFKVFRSADSERLTGGENFFLSKWVMTGIKRFVFLRRFQICNLTLVTKCL